MLAPARVKPPRTWKEAVERDKALIAESIRRRKSAVEYERRRKLASELDQIGTPLREIAKQAGYGNPSCAKRAIDAYAREMKRGCADGEAWAQRERERLLHRNETLMRELWPRCRRQKLKDGTVIEPDLAAIAMVLKLDERRAKLIGADAPTRQEVAGPGGAPLAVEFREVEQIREAMFAVVADRPELRDAIAAKLAGEAPANGHVAALPAPPTNGTAY